MIYLTALVTIIGVLIGSFLNVCISRIPRKESVIYPPSHCTNCGTRLKSIDLIPIISFMTNKGNCKYCGEKISIQYPIVEVLTGITFLLSFNRYGLSLDFIFYTILFCALIVISGIDYYYQIIFDEFIISSFVLGLIFKLSSYCFNGQVLFINDSLIGILVGGGCLLLIAIVSKGGMGGGDIKLMASLGFWIGWKYTIIALLLSFIIGGILSSGLLALKIKSKSDAIPFGPFLSLGFFITALYGVNIIEWYLNVFF